MVRVSVVYTFDSWNSVPLDTLRTILDEAPDTVVREIEDWLYAWPQPANFDQVATLVKGRRMELEQASPPSVERTERYGHYMSTAVFIG